MAPTKTVISIVVKESTAKIIMYFFICKEPEIGKKLHEKDLSTNVYSKHEQLEET